MTTICLIPGDGVGREVIPAAARVLAALQPDLKFTWAEAGWDCFQRRGTALPAETEATVAAAGATLFGAAQSPSQPAPGYFSPILALRQRFDLYANLRPVVTLLPGQPQVDLLIVRENTQGLYSGRERVQGDEVIAERVITRAASERIAVAACEQARRRAAARGRPGRLTIVHKANVLRQSDGLFRRACLDAARRYPDLEVDELLVDAAAMWLARDPARFDVLVTTNLFGDILSDLAAGLAGGLGVAPSATLHPARQDGPAVFEPVHGSAPDIAGQGIANPVAALLSAAMMLDHLQRPQAADALRSAVYETLAAGICTPDLGGDAATAGVTDAVLARLRPTTCHLPSATCHLPPAACHLDLLRRLVEIPSPSGQEGRAAAFLVDWMAAQGFDARVDEAGNAVGILDGGPGADGVTAEDIVLLGHIDTVPGTIPVRVEEGCLYGRGAVDAKGPLATFAVAAARARARPGFRLVVIGAVEEEAATSKGARHVASRYRPAAAIIGEPSGWTRLTLGYKGRLLVDASFARPMSHTAGPDESACEIAFGFWQRVRKRMAELNAGRERAWDQVLPSLRGFHSASDGLTETARLHLGFRLPPDLAPDTIKAILAELADGAALEFRGEELAYRADKNTPLVRAFLAAIRAAGERPGFVLKTGTSDMNVVGAVWNCPMLAYGAGDSALDHTPHEHVLIAEWQRSIEVLEGVLGMLMA